MVEPALSASEPSAYLRGLRAPITYHDACEQLEAVLTGRARSDVLDALEHAGDFAGACHRLRAAMRSHTLPSTTGPIALQRTVSSLDDRTRREGFHVLESWDYRAHRFADEMAPVLMLDRHAGPDWCGGGGRDVLAVLLDQYLLTVLGLCAVRAWDDGDANANLDRLTRLVGLLNGPDGSGHRFVDDAETLLLLAISHYHPHEVAYDTLIHKVWSLDDAHRLSVALACAGALGGHLRWGLRYMYRRDVGRMRDDNIVDYPWLLFSAATLARAYACTNTPSDAVVEGLLNAFTADPWAFAGSAPAGMRPYLREHAEVRASIAGHASALAETFARHQPTAKTYSPLGFQSNFLCNAFVAMVATAMIDGEAHPSLNGLFTRDRADGLGADAVERYARRLMGYAGAGAGHAEHAALIIYDPYEAAHSFNMGMQVLAASR
jgi:hypothetical protein